MRILTRLAEQHRKWRALLAIVLLLVILLVFLPERPGQTGTSAGAVTSRTMEGKVVEINTGEGQSLRSGNTVRMSTARIALDDGVETRVLLTGRSLQLGERVTLRETVRADGTRHFRLAEP